MEEALPLKKLPWVTPRLLLLLPLAPLEVEALPWWGWVEEEEEEEEEPVGDEPPLDE